MSITRLVILLQNLKSTDPSWDFVHIANWNAIEVNSAIVVVCLIVLKPLFRKFAPRLAIGSDRGPVLHEAHGRTLTRRPRILGLWTTRWSTAVETGEGEGEGEGEVLGDENEKQLARCDASRADVESQGSSGGRAGQMAEGDQRAREA